MKTLLIGNFGGENLGDELILNAGLESYSESIVMTNDSDFSQNFCETQFQTVPFVPVGVRSFCKFLLSSAYRKHFSNIRDEVEQIVFPGGGLFAIKFQAVLHWFLVFLWIQKLFKNKPIIFEGQGVDPNLNWMAKKMVKYVFSRAKKIQVRDAASGGALSALDIKNVEVGEDVVAKFLREQPFWKPSAKGEKIVLLNAISEVPNSLFEKIQEKYNDHQIIFLAFHASDKKNAPHDLGREVYYPVSKTELANRFEKADVVIGERFHFLIFGEFFCQSEGAFTLREPYSVKVKNFTEVKKIKNFEKEN